MTNLIATHAWDITLLLAAIGLYAAMLTRIITIVSQRDDLRMELLGALQALSEAQEHGRGAGEGCGAQEASWGLREAIAVRADGNTYNLEYFRSPEDPPSDYGKALDRLNAELRRRYGVAS